MFNIHREEIEWGGRKLVLETGKVARQADGAVMATYGETVVLATAVGMTEAPAQQAPVVVVSVVPRPPTTVPLTQTLSSVTCAGASKNTAMPRTDPPESALASVVNV